MRYVLGVLAGLIIGVLSGLALIRYSEHGMKDEWVGPKGFVKVNGVTEWFPAPALTLTTQEAAA